METSELLMHFFGFPLWFAKLLAEHFPPNFTITEDMEENWMQILSEHLNRAKEKVRDDSNLAGFLEPCLLDSQLLAFAQSAGQCEESDLILIHIFFCHCCNIKYGRFIWEEAILEGLRSIQNHQCPESDIIFGHLYFLMKNPGFTEETEPLYKRIQQFGYPKFILLVMNHINGCYQCKETFEELQRASKEMESEDQILDQLEAQFKNLPPN